jgi:hypothetical protein
MILVGYVFGDGRVVRVCISRFGVRRFVAEIKVPYLSRWLDLSS